MINRWEEYFKELLNKKLPKKAVDQEGDENFKIILRC